MFTVRVAEHDEFHIEFYEAVRILVENVEDRHLARAPGAKVGEKFVEWCDTNGNWRCASNGKLTISILNDRGIEIDRF